MDKSISIRVGWVIICCLVGFAFPLTFLIAAWLAITIYSDLSESKLEPPTAPDAQLDYLGLKSLRANHHDWLNNFREFCESPAEVAFLETMVKSFKLIPQNGILTGNGLSLRLQVPIRPYRLDFLVDERLVVEIDGAAWHSSPEAIKKDKKRDTFLRSQGYIVLRIPAKVTLYNSAQAIVLVQDARLGANKKVEELAKNISEDNATKIKQRNDLLRPQNLFKSVLSALEATNDTLSDLNRKADISLATANGKNEVALLWEAQRDDIEMLLSHAKFKLEIDAKLQSNPEIKELFFETLNSMKQKKQDSSRQSEQTKVQIDYSNILEKVNFSDLDKNNEKSDELRIARQNGREQSVLVYEKYMQSLYKEFQENPNLEKMFHKVCRELEAGHL